MISVRTRWPPKTSTDLLQREGQPSDVYVVSVMIFVYKAGPEALSRPASVADARGRHAVRQLESAAATKDLREGWSRRHGCRAGNFDKSAARMQKPLQVIVLTVLPRTKGATVSSF